VDRDNFSGYAVLMQVPIFTVQTLCDLVQQDYNRLLTHLDKAVELEQEMSDGVDRERDGDGKRYQRSEYSDGGGSEGGYDDDGKSAYHLATHRTERSTMRQVKSYNMSDAKSKHSSAVRRGRVFKRQYRSCIMLSLRLSVPMLIGMVWVHTYMHPSHCIDLELRSVPASIDPSFDNMIRVGTHLSGRTVQLALVAFDNIGYEYIETVEHGSDLLVELTERNVCNGRCILVCTIVSRNHVLDRAFCNATIVRLRR
jgi:hypothetical protein